MSGSSDRVEAFYAGAKDWKQELLALRKLLQDSPLQEEFKWRSPCYTIDGGNVATVWGLKDGCVLSFFKGVLLKDPEGILEAPGENSRSVRLFRFTEVAELEKRAGVLADYIREAAENEKAGLKVVFPKDDLDYPQELVERLETEEDLREAWDKLTPGRQRGYVLHFSGAKQSATREGRIDKATPRILEGKGMHDR